MIDDNPNAMPRCPQCTTPMDELSRRWGDEAYYGIWEHIEYGCSHCGERMELKYDVPAEILPFMPPDDEDYDDENDETTYGNTVYHGLDDDDWFPIEGYEP